MAEEGSVLRVAETERDHAAALLADHKQKCRIHGEGPDCALLESHVARTELQVELLLAADAGTDVMF